MVKAKSNPGDIPMVEAGFGCREIVHYGKFQHDWGATLVALISLVKVAGV